jgi:hypothetical protein
MRITKTTVALSSVMALLIACTVAFGGGWATLTVNGVPDYFVAGKSVPLTFLVRAHGVTLADGMNTNVTAKMEGEKEIRFTSGPTGRTGEYKTVVTLPKPGEWTIRINSGWMGIPFDMVPMKAIAAGSPPPPPMTQIERGERLFVTRGCIGCHENKDVRSINFAKVGPALTGRKFPADALKAFLADPSKSWKGQSEPQIGQMPNLHLDSDEIDGLVAFLNRARD